MAHRFFLALISAALLAIPVHADVTAFHHLANQLSTDQTSYTTASVTTRPKSVLQACFGSNVAAGTPNVPTITDSGGTLTWASLGSSVRFNLFTGGAGTSRCSCFYAITSARETITITADFAGQTQTYGTWGVDTFEGIPLDASFIVQTATDGVDVSTTPSVTLGAFSSTNNATEGCHCTTSNSAITPEGGWTELSEANGTGTGGLEVQFIVTNDTTSTATGASSNWGSLGVELKQISPGVSFSQEQTQSTSVDGTSFSTASWTPVANTDYVVFQASNTASGTPAVPTMTHSGMTFTEQKTQTCCTSTNGRVTVFTMRGASPGASATTADFGATTQNGHGMWIGKLEGNLGGILRQTPSDTGSSSTPNVTFQASFGGTSNPTLIVILTDNGTSTGTAPTTMSEYMDADTGGHRFYVAAVHQAVTNPTVTMTTSSAWGAIAIEAWGVGLAVGASGDAGALLMRSGQ